MSILNVPLRKLLSLFYANNRLRRKILLADIGSDARKEGGVGDLTVVISMRHFGRMPEPMSPARQILRAKPKYELRPTVERLDYTRYSEMHP
jgi:hypothetical protein